MRRTTLLLAHHATERPRHGQGRIRGHELWTSIVAKTHSESTWKRRHLSRHPAILNIKFPDDVMVGVDLFEQGVRQYHAVSGKHIEEDTMSRVILEGLAKSSNEKQRDLANHLVLNAHRLDSSSKILLEIHEILGTEKYMNQESAIHTVSKTKGEKGGKGKKGKKDDSKGQITIKFTGRVTSNKTVCTTQVGDRRPK